MSADDLPTELRSWNPTWRADGTSHLVHQAADRIEQLEAENAELHEALALDPNGVTIASKADYVLKVTP